MAGAGVACGSFAVAWVTGAGVWAAECSAAGCSAVVLGVAREFDGGDGRRFRRRLQGWGVGDDSRLRE